VYKLVRTTQFKKDIKKYKYSKPTIEAFKQITELLIHGKELPANAKDHELHGELRKCRECHVRPNVCLIYKKDENNDAIYFVRLGSHSDLFE